jgi:hypothetical protein
MEHASLRRGVAVRAQARLGNGTAPLGALCAVLGRCGLLRTRAARATCATERAAVADKHLRRTEVARCEYSEYPCAQRSARLWPTKHLRRTEVARCEYSEYPCAQRSARRRPTSSSGMRPIGIATTDHRVVMCGKGLEPQTATSSNQNVARTRCRCETSPGADVAGKFQSQCRMARGEPSLSDVERGEWPPGGGGGGGGGGWFFWPALKKPGGRGAGGFF